MRSMLVVIGLILLYPQSLLAAELPRRVSLGVMVKPVSDETVAQLKLRRGNGVEVVQTLPDSVAAIAGITSGDVLLSLGDHAIKDLTDFVAQVSQLREGKALRITLRRGDSDLNLQLDLKPLPLETSDQLDIEYSFVETPKGRLRTVLTTPKGQKQSKAILLLSGLGLGFVEHPTADPLGMKQLAYALTKSGFAVMRVDRPGCGDSEGGPARDADFQSIVDGYVAATAALKKSPKVSREVYLLGFSAGALEAPLVASREDVAGIAIFGSLSLDWQEYMRSTTRRQLTLAGVPADQVDQAVREQASGWRSLIEEGLAPDDIANKHTELIDWVDHHWDDGTYFSGIHFKFYQQLGKANIADAWRSFNGRVLAMWGNRDIVTDEAEHQRIVEMVNNARAGSAAYLTLNAVDHNLLDTNTKTIATEKIVEIVARWIEKS